MIYNEILKCMMGYTVGYTVGKFTTMTLESQGNCRKIA